MTRRIRSSESDIAALQFETAAATDTVVSSARKPRGHSTIGISRVIRSRCSSSGRATGMRVPST